MAALEYPEGTFVVVTTGEEAKTFHVRNGSLQFDADWTANILNSEGPSGKSPPESSPRENDEATFSKQIAERLYKLAYDGAFEHLILVADPDSLGEIRPLLHREVTEKLVLEQAKTLINSPVEEIERSLRK